MTAIEAVTQEIGSPEWYSDMLEYIKKSPNADEIAGDLLKQGGLVEKHGLHATEHGADFFLALSEIDLKGALAFLDRFISVSSTSDLLEFEQGRHQAVRILDRAATREDLFSDSARLLLALGETDRQTGPETAGTVFACLFWSRYHYRISQVSTAQRLSVLEKTLRSNSKQRQMLAIKACRFALDLVGYTSSHFGIKDSSFGASINVPNHDNPDNLSEDGCHNVACTLVSLFGKLDADVRKEVISLILDRVPSFEIFGVIHKDRCSDRIIDEIITGIFEKYYVPERLARNLKKLYGQMTRNEYCYLLLDHWGDLARRSFDVNLLEPKLRWLSTIAIEFGGWWFGYSLGQVDEDFKSLPTVLKMQRNTKDLDSEFLDGYFYALRDRDVAKWESTLDSMLNDPKLYKFVITITREYWITERAGKRITSLIKKYNLDCDAFYDLCWWEYPERLPPKSAVEEWIEFMLNKKDPMAMEVALDLLCTYLGEFIEPESKGHMKVVQPLHVYVYSAKKISQNLVLRVLLHKDTICKLFVSRSDSEFVYQWSELIQDFVKQYPEKSTVIAEVLLEYYIKYALFDRYGSKVQEILDKIARIKPLEMWKVVYRHIEKFLLNRKDPRAIGVAAGLFDRYFVQDDGSISQALVLRVLLHRNTIDRLLVSRHDESFVSKWAKASLKFAKQHPDRSVAIAKAVLEYYTRDALFDQYDPEVYKVLNEIVRTRPAHMWEIISRHIGPPVDSRAFRIRTWLKKEGLFKSKSELFEDIPSEIVWP